MEKVATSYKRLFGATAKSLSRGKLNQSGRFAKAMTKKVGPDVFLGAPKGTYSTFVRPEIPGMIDAATGIPLSSLARNLKGANTPAKAITGTKTWVKDLESGPMGEIALKHFKTRKAAPAVAAAAGVASNLAGVFSPGVPAGIMTYRKIVGYGNKLKKG